MDKRETKIMLCAAENSQIDTVIRLMSNKGPMLIMDMVAGHGHIV